MASDLPFADELVGPAVPSVREPSREREAEPSEILARELRPRLTDVVNSVLRSVLKRSENPGYAEDIVNEALAAAYEKRRSYDPARGRLYTWLVQIVKNRTFD